MKKPKNNKIILILSLLLVFIIMGAASAATDDNINDTVSSDENVIQDPIMDSVVYCELHPGEVADANVIEGTQAESDTLGAASTDENSNENSDVLADEEDSDVGSFTELEQYIKDNKGYGKVVQLNKDYSLNNITDVEYNDRPIYIQTFVEIDGNNHYIDAKNNPYIFKSIGENIVLKNIRFINCSSNALIISSGFVTITNCTFENSTGNSINIENNGINSVIQDSKFYNNGHIYISSTNVIIKNSIFENNTADNGGALYIDGDMISVENCIFTNNTARDCGGAILFNGKLDESYSLNVLNSRFIRNNAATGGAIYTRGAIWNANVWKSINSNVTITSSEFVQNKACTDFEIGGPMGDVSPYTITDSTRDGGISYDDFGELFRNIGENSVINLEKDYVLNYGNYKIYHENVTIDGHGYTIDANGYSVFVLYKKTFTLKNITIKNAKSNSYGSVVYSVYAASDFAKVNIVNGKFYNNSANNGGVLAGTRLSLGISNSVFENNSATDSGGAIYIYTPGGECSYCNFTNNVAKNGGVFGSGNSLYNSGNWNYCRFVNNTADNGGVHFAGANQGNKFKAYNSVFINNTAIFNPLTNLNSNGRLLDADRNNQFDSNIEDEDIKNLVQLLSQGGNIVLPNKTYNLRSISILINTKDSSIDCNGSTFIGQGQILMSFASRKFTVENFTVINGSIYCDQSVNIGNAKFYNSSNPLQAVNSGNLYNIECYNCTNILNSMWLSINITNLKIDDVVYYNDELYSIFKSYRVLGPNSRQNITIVLDKKDYLSVIPYYIFGTNLIIDGNGSTITSSIDKLRMFRLYGENITIKNFIIKDTANPIEFTGSKSSELWDTDNTFIKGHVNN